MSLRAYYLYEQKETGNNLFICLRIVSLLFTGNSREIFGKLKASMLNEFEMTDDELMSYFLGIKVW